MPSLRAGANNVIYYSTRSSYPYTQKDLFELTKSTVENYLQAANITEEKRFKHKLKI